MNVYFVAKNVCKASETRIKQYLLNLFTIQANKLNNRSFTSSDTSHSIFMLENIFPFLGGPCCTSIVRTILLRDTNWASFKSNMTDLFKQSLQKAGRTTVKHL